MMKCIHVRTVAVDTDTIQHQVQVNAALELIIQKSIHTIQHSVTHVDGVFGDESQRQTRGPGWVYSTIIFYWENA